MRSKATSLCVSRSPEPSFVSLEEGMISVGKNKGKICDEVNYKRPTMGTRLNILSQQPSSPSKEIKASFLPEEITRHIYNLMSDAKTLGEIARILLIYFNEHERHQRQSLNSDDIFPITMVAGDIYSMSAPRKRRIYDVLHVLEGMTCYFDVKTTPFQSVIVGIGVLKRVRKDEYEGPKSRGGHYQYFGRDAALSTLIEHYTRVQKVIEEYATAKNATITLDQSILQSCEQIPGYAKLPALSSTTITFLSLLLEEAPKTFVALPELSARLAEARREIISADSNANLLDINRRMYDVVSVLISCKILLCPKTNQASKKVVAFNHEVFTDDSALKIGSTWDREPYCDASFCRSIEVEEQKNKFPKNLLRQKHRSKTTKISKKRKSISYPESPRDVAAGLSHFHVVAHLSTPDRIKLRKKVKITEEHLTSPSLTELFLCEENSATQFDGNLTWHERFVCLEEADFLDFVPINDILQWEKMDLMNQMEELWPNLYCDKEGSTHEVEMEPEDEESFMDLTCQEQLFEGW